MRKLFKHFINTVHVQLYAPHGSPILYDLLADSHVPVPDTRDHFTRVDESAAIIQSVSLASETPRGGDVPTQEWDEVTSQNDTFGRKLECLFKKEFVDFVGLSKTVAPW